MFSAQIGSPNSSRIRHRSSVHTPFTFRRRSGPLFPATPSPRASFIANSFGNPDYSFSSPAPATLSFPSQNSPTAISDFTNILRWAPDGQLHPIEYFTTAYGGSKTLPPIEWTQAPTNLRVDTSDGKSYDLLSFIAEYGGSQQFPPQEWLSSRAAPMHFDNSPQQPQLPWGDNLKTPTFLFRVAPPKLRYPTGSNDENINAHFVRSALGYLRSSTYVRDVIDWDPRPHPFYQYQPLTAFATANGFPDFVFEPSSTLSTPSWPSSCRLVEVKKEKDEIPNNVK